MPKWDKAWTDNLLKSAQRLLRLTSHDDTRYIVANTGLFENETDENGVVQKTVPTASDLETARKSLKERYGRT